MTRDANSLIRRGLDMLQDVLDVVADVREGAEKTGEHHDAPRGRVVASTEEHKTSNEDLSAFSSEELHARVVTVLAEVADIAEELARRAEHGARVLPPSSAGYANSHENEH